MDALGKKDIYEWICFLFIGFVAFLVLSSVLQALLLPDYSAFLKAPLALVFSWVLLYAYGKYARLYTGERCGLSLVGQMPRLAVGWVVIAFYFLVVIGGLYVMGCYVPAKIHFDLPSQVEGLAIFLVVAVNEEVMCRGIVYRLMADRWGVATALVVSSALFGIMHIFNDGATLWSALAIAVSSGWLLGIAYSYHCTLWAPVGMHWAWNYLEGSVFGCMVSGNAPIGTPLVTSSLAGADWLTGGVFGPEASVLTVAVGIVVSAIYTMLYAHRSKMADARRLSQL